MTRLSTLFLALVLTGATPAPLAAETVQSATAAPREAQPVRTPVSSGQQVAPVTAGLLGAPLVPDGIQSVRGEVRESAVGWYHYPDPVPGGAPPSGGIGTALLGGFATWFDTCPDCAAAGPALRHALGPHWRGSLVDVASRYGSATLRLTDWCACRNRQGLPTLLDVSVEAFNDLSPYPARSDRDPGYVAVSIEICRTTGPG